MIFCEASCIIDCHFIMCQTEYDIQHPSGNLKPWTDIDLINKYPLDTQMSFREAYILKQRLVGVIYTYVPRSLTQRLNQTHTCRISPLPHTALQIHSFNRFALGFPPCLLCAEGTELLILFFSVHVHSWSVSRWWDPRLGT